MYTVPWLPAFLSFFFVRFLFLKLSKNFPHFYSTSLNGVWKEKNTVFHNRAPTLAYILSQPHSYLINPNSFYTCSISTFFLSTRIEGNDGEEKPIEERRESRIAHWSSWWFLGLKKPQNRVPEYSRLRHYDTHSVYMCVCVCKKHFLKCCRFMIIFSTRGRSLARGTTVAQPFKRCSRSHGDYTHTFTYYTHDDWNRLRLEVGT